MTVRLGRVDDKRGLDRQRELLDQPPHHRRLVGALGERHADVERVRAALDLVARDRDHLLDAVLERQALRPLREPCVLSRSPITSGARLLPHRGRRHAARQEPAAARPGAATARGRARSPPPARGCARACVPQQPPTMFTPSSTTNSRSVSAIGSGLHRVERATAVVDRKPGVGDAVNRRAGVLRQVADRVAHQVRTGRAVEADDVDAHRLERRERAADVGAEQHAARRVERDRALDRDDAAGARERLAARQNLGLHLEDVLRGLEDEHVGAALDEPPAPARRKPRPAPRGRACRARDPRTTAAGPTARSSPRRSAGGGPPLRTDRRRGARSRPRRGSSPECDPRDPIPRRESATPGTSRSRPRRRRPRSTRGVHGFDDVGPRERQQGSRCSLLCRRSLPFVSVRAWSCVPMAPSKTRTRSRRESRKRLVIFVEGGCLRGSAAPGTAGNGECGQGIGAPPHDNPGRAARLVSKSAAAVLILSLASPIRPRPAAATGFRFDLVRPRRVTRMPLVLDLLRHGHAGSSARRRRCRAHAEPRGTPHGGRARRAAEARRMAASTARSRARSDARSSRPRSCSRCSERCPRSRRLPRWRRIGSRRRCVRSRPRAFDPGRSCSWAISLCSADWSRISSVTSTRSPPESSSASRANLLDPAQRLDRLLPAGVLKALDLRGRC